MIERVTPGNLDDALTLIRQYQQFYHITDINDEKNRQFFLQFAEDNDRGVQHLYRVDEKPAGFTTTYFNFSSAAAEPVAVLNDLFVALEYRRRGIGRELIYYVTDFVKENGYTKLYWLTQKNNKKAQRLYDSLGATRSEWLFYSLTSQL